MRIILPVLTGVLRRAGSSSAPGLAEGVRIGGTVTLLGYVTQPTLKDDAEGVVKRIEGVEQVRNEIEVLPVSPEDDPIRIAECRASRPKYGRDPRPACSRH